MWTCSDHESRVQVTGCASAMLSRGSLPQPPRTQTKTLGSQWTRVEVYQNSPLRLIMDSWFGSGRGSPRTAGCTRAATVDLIRLDPILLNPLNNKQQPAGDW